MLSLMVEKQLERTVKRLHAALPPVGAPASFQRSFAAAKCITDKSAKLDKLANVQQRMPRYPGSEAGEKAPLMFAQKLLVCMAEFFL
jgi:hypothetical protein